MSSLTGDLFALGAAVCWAIGSLLFSRVRVAAPGINLFKNTLSCVLLLIVIGALQSGRPSLPVDAVAWAWLAVSAACGLVIGDTCHFRSLQILGPRRCVVLETLAPPLGAVFGWFFLAEHPSAWLWLGMAVTLSGVVLVILERTGGAEAPGHFPGSTARGVVLGLAAALCQALGAAWSKLGIQRLAVVGVDGDQRALEATCMRLLVAVALGLLIGRLRGQLVGWVVQLRSAGTLRLMIPASITGTFLGVWCSMLAFQHTTIAEATTLSATSPIFVIPLVIFVLRQRVSWLALLGAVLAVVGVAILCWRQA